MSNADNLSGKVFKDNPDNLGIAPVPSGSVRSGAPVGGHDYAVYAGSKNLGLLPTRASAYDLPEAKANPQVVQWQKPIESAVERPWIPEAASLFQPLLEGYQKLAGGQATAEQMLEEVAAEYQGILKGWSR